MYRAKVTLKMGLRLRSLRRNDFFSRSSTWAQCYHESFKAGKERDGIAEEILSIKGFKSSLVAFKMEGSQDKECMWPLEAGKWKDFLLELQKEPTLSTP